MRPAFAFILLVLCGILLPAQVRGQIFLQVETAGSLNVRRIPKGEELTFSLRSAPNQWLTRELTDLYPEAKRLQFPDGSVPLDSIAAIRFPGSNRLAKGIGATILTFTGVWTLYSLLDMAINTRAPAPFQYWVAGTGLAAGSVLEWGIPPVTRRIGKRHRLRILDLTFYPEKNN